MELVKKSITSLFRSHFFSRIQTPALVLLDVFTTIASLCLAFLLHGSSQTLGHEFRFYWWIFPLSILVRLAMSTYFRLYNHLWRYASIRELLALIRAVSVGSVVLYGIAWSIAPTFPFPVIAIDWLISIVMMGMVRTFARVSRDFFHARLSTKQSVSRVLVIGAGDGGEMIAREMLRPGSQKYRVVGFVDDSKRKIGQTIHQIPVLGPTEQIGPLCQQHQIDEVIFAIPSASGTLVRRIMTSCENLGIPLKVTPGLFDIIDGKVSVTQLRKLRIEDLLGRAAIRTNLSEVSEYLRNSVVMVTGGGGSIGAELCRQILRFSPSHLLVVDQAESSLFHVDAYFRQHNKSQTRIIPLVANIGNRARMEAIFNVHSPSIVFHAAAYKHVPLMEENPSEAIQNNILGTRVMLELCRDRVKRFVLISTDKAVNPANCMGASKRICEIMLQAAAVGSSTIFCAVRFGNVLGSEGSVVPIFQKQILEGGPITVTDPNITRFFMTIPEAVSLIMQAGASSVGGEIFILDMGEPVNILQLAKDMIHLSGLIEGEDIEIRYTGLRPGEKLYEELSYNQENLLPSPHKKIMVAQLQTFDAKLVSSEVNALVQVSQTEPSGELRTHIFRCLERISANLVPLHAR